MISIAKNYVHVYAEDRRLVDCKNCPSIIEGKEVYEAMFPVNHLTGKRENPLTLVHKVLDVNKRQLLDSILQEIPQNREYQQLDDKSQLEFLSDRLSNGYPADKDYYLKQLSQIADVVLPVINGAPKEGTIQFEQNDNPEPSASE